MLKKRDPLRKGFEVLYTVRLLKSRINRVQNKISERINELSKRMLDLEAKNEKYLAKRYAEEIAKLKGLSRRIDVLHYVVDKVDLAVQHAIVLKEFQVLSKELGILLKDITKLPETRIPDVSILFADLDEMIRELSDITGVTSTDALTYTNPSSSEVKTILSEAREMLRRSLEPES